MRQDTLRPPAPMDPTAAAYKDWLHVNLFDHASGSIGLLNVSLHGPLDDARSRAIGTALMHVPGSGWAGNVEVTALEDAGLFAAGIALEHVAIALDETGTLHFAGNFGADGLRVRGVARADARPFVIEERLPFGPGWISWRVVPRLRLEGELETRSGTSNLARTVAYHDHNWGRWHWGDDIGWNWGAFLAPAGGPAIIVSRATDRNHRARGRAVVNIDADGTRRTFVGPAVSIAYDGRLAPPPRRLPGALAVLQQSRARPHLPAHVRVCADDGVDRVVVEMRCTAAAQLIAGDPVRRGYGFIHQIVGEYSAEGRLSGRTFATMGLAVFEHVD